MRGIFIFTSIILWCIGLVAQPVKILFDATKAETANNADWVIDEDMNNLGWNPGATVGGGSEGNAQRIPTPAQSGITSFTSETYWKGALSSWGVDCVKRGYVVETLPYNGSITYGNTGNAQDLSNYKVFIVCEPNILFTAAEKTAILNFVQNGGSLFMVSDHTNSDRNGDGKDSPDIWNDLMSNNTVKSNPFGITFDLANVSPNSTNIPNLPNDSLLHGPMGAVTQAVWFNGTTMTLNPSVNTSVKGVVYTPGSSFGNTGVMAAYARFGKGKVAALGDSSPCDDGTGDSGDQLYDGWITDAAGNHERLIMNATIWLATNDSATSAPPALKKDLRMDSIMAPIAMQLGTNVVKLCIQNIGKANVDTCTIAYRLDATSPVTESRYTLNLAPDSFYTLSFSIPATITGWGSHTLCAWVKAPGDSTPANDTLCKSFMVKEVGIVIPPQPPTVVLFPNPTISNELNIQSVNEAIEEFRIVNALGKEILSHEVNGCANVKITIPNLTPGVYLVFVQTETGVEVFKWIRK